MNEFANTWFFNNDWKPYPFQEKTWAAIAAGKSGLLNAPTGYGKTFAIWFGILDNYYKKKKQKNKLHCLWITPLRALSKEILNATQLVSRELELDYTIGLRTGDTPPSERSKQNKKPPHAFITTPESVHIQLATKGYSNYFQDLEFVIVDEWHELLGSKRGVLVELALSRLKNLNPKLKIWGISATIGNLKEAKTILLRQDKHTVLIKSDIKKNVRMETILPDTLDKFPWAGHLGLKLANKALDIIHKNQSTLLFTNTRSQAEIWYNRLLESDPGLAGLLALHHGSLSEELRQWVEAALHDGRLKAVVCTSSLDLGVDFRPVDCVIQIGSPKGIARFLQRAGRSGHQPGALSKIYFLPTHSLEIMEGAALKYAVKANKMEQRQPYIRSFDVLLQYMVTLAVSEGFEAGNLYREILSTHCFESVSRSEFEECLKLLTYGGNALESYDEFHKVVFENGLYKVNSKRVAMRHRLSIGTIVSDNMMLVKFLSGKYLGSIEESFISRLKPEDTFSFAGKQLQLIRVKDMQALVRPSKNKNGIIPSWQGGRFPISRDLGEALRHVLSFINKKDKNQPAEIRFLQPLFQEQQRKSQLPREDELLLEYIKTRYGYHLFIYPFEGKFIHEGMAAVIAYRLGKIRQSTFSIASNEYGFELLSDSEIPVNEALGAGLFSTENLFEDIRQGVNIQEMAKRKFRDIAGIAGLVFQGFPGKQVKTRHLQANSALFFKVFEEYDPYNLLLRQAYEEVYDFQLEAARLSKAFQRISHHEILLSKPKRLSPFAFPIFSESFRERYSNENWQLRLQKLIAQLEQT